MKGIIIQDCLSCPFSDIKGPIDDGGSSLICTLGKNMFNEIEELCRMDKGDYKIPDWCRLDDLQEIVESAVLEYNVKCKEISK